MTKRIFLIASTLIILPTIVYAAATDYLILQDIGSHKLFTGISGRVFSGPPSKFSQTNTGGVLDAAGHFSEGDISYEASYTETSSKWPFVKVEVTRHCGSDSDKWLMHEVESSYRDNDDSDNRLGLLSGAGVKIRDIGGNKFIYWGLGGGSYAWISDQKVIEITYTDLQRTKPEPLEVIQAYLQKLPSTIPATLVLDKAHDEKWLKDEMERRLWLCDKWIAWYMSGKTTADTLIGELVDHLGVFLDYRQKYFGIDGKADKKLLSQYQLAGNAEGIKTKLTEYKQWWISHKNDPITLP